MPHLKVDGVNVNYRVTGKGDPIVLLHGGGSNGAQWKGISNIMQKGWRLFTMDQYGHGGTDQWPGLPENRTYDAEASLVRGVINYIGKPVHLVGHSFGGSIALRLAVNDSHKLRSLTLIEPNGHSVFIGSGEDPKSAFVGVNSKRFLELVHEGKPELAMQEYMDTYSAHGTWKSMPTEVKTQYLINIDNFISGMHCNLSEPTTPDDCRNIGLTTLVMYGDKSQAYYRRLSELLIQLLPNAKMEVLPGAAHMSPLTHPERIASKLAAHLKSVESEKLT
ncbi:alpha/beta hydrolase [bacterium]|nr:alpha/beta hydrolase [bacterium]